MKRLSLTITVCLLLSGCTFDPVFDTSSWGAFQQSVEAINRKLSNDDARRLNVALNYLLSDSLPPAGFSGLPVSFKGNAPTPNVVLAQLGPKINGWSAAEVISNLALALDTEIAAMESQKVRDVLSTVAVSSPRYDWNGASHLRLPTIQFSVRNEGSIPISRIYFKTVLVSPGRTIPWASQTFVQDFKGGLEPREKREINLLVGGLWQDPQLQYLPNAELKVTLSNFTDVNGVMVAAVDSERLELERKVRAELRWGGIR